MYMLPHSSHKFLLESNLPAVLLMLLAAMQNNFSSTKLTTPGGVNEDSSLQQNYTPSPERVEVRVGLLCRGQKLKATACRAPISAARLYGACAVTA